MSSANAHPEDLLALYALGACSQAEAEQVSEHLSGCASCRGTAARLGEGARTLLVDVAPATPDPAIKARLMAQVHAEAALFDSARSDRVEPSRVAVGAASSRRSWRPSLPIRFTGRTPIAALASGLALAAGAALWSGVVGSGTDQSRVLTAQISGRQAPGASGRLEIRGGSGELRVRGLPNPGRGRVYQVWVRKNRQVPEPAGTSFTVGVGGAGQTRLPGDIRGFRQVLVTSEPAGGSRLPTRVPVLEIDTSV